MLFVVNELIDGLKGRNGQFHNETIIIIGGAN